MKKIIAGVLLVSALTACGSDVRKLEMECRDAGGEVVKVDTQVTCLKDGAVIAEWEDYSE